MSGILKLSVKKVIILLNLALLEGALILHFAGYMFFGLLLFLSAVAITGIYALNEAVRRKMRISVLPFAAVGGIRNVDYLVIGGRAAEVFEPGMGRSVVRLAAPFRSLQSSYEILRHTYGILKAGGTAVIVANEEEILCKCFSIYDVPVLELSPVSVTRLHLEKLKKAARLPVVVNPIDSVQYLLWNRNVFKGEFKKVECPVREMTRFCEEREIRLEFYVVKGRDKYG